MSLNSAYKLENPVRDNDYQEAQRRSNCYLAGRAYGQTSGDNGGKWRRTWQTNNQLGLHYYSDNYRPGMTTSPACDIPIVAAAISTAILIAFAVSL
tara:strand:+ start:80 stop:367 length:288 start_codon:yes stop_codon:yes gene_type:complete